MNMSAWVISLNNQSENTKKLMADLGTEGLAPQLFGAVDGRQGMPKLQTGEKVSSLRSLINRRRLLTSTEVGCYLSHYRLIKRAYQAGDSHVLIFEDDAVLEPNFGDVVKEIVQLPDHYHLIRLMARKVRKRKILADLTPPYRLTKPIRGALGAQAYILNRAGMEKILTQGKVLSMPIDKLYDSFFLFNLNCYCVEPHCIYELDHPTQIDKAYDQIDKRLLLQLAWRANKLYRSVRRRIYSFKNSEEHKGATFPDKKMGKSTRIRY
jgi:glycosyl transferase, family 25